MINKRDHGIDCLRGLSILLVLGIHFFDLYIKVHGKSSAPLNIFGHGYYGVTIFFVISGYLITRTSVKVDANKSLSINAARFYTRRATRILPLLIAVCVASFVYMVLYGRESLEYNYTYHESNDVFTAWFWISIATFQYNWYKIYAAFNDRYSGLQWDILWSLAVEEQFYLLFPGLITLVANIKSLRKALVFIIILCSALRALFIFGNVGGDLANNASISCFDSIAIGALLAVAPAGVYNFSRIALCLSIAIFVPCYLMRSYEYFGLGQLGISIAAGLFIASSKNIKMTPAQKLLMPFAEIGKLSYGAYLLHPAVMFLSFNLCIGSKIGPFYGFAAYVIILYLVSKISFVWFEQPVERYLRRLANNHITQPESAFNELRQQENQKL